MPQIEEGRLRTLEAAEHRLPTVEAENATLKAQLSESQRRTAVAEASEYARAFARKLVVEANAELPGAVVDKIVRESTRDVPLGDDMRLDTETLSKTVEEARSSEETYLAQIAHESGIGSVRGIGATAGTTEISEADVQREIDALFRPGGN